MSSPTESSTTKPTVLAQYFHSLGLQVGDHVAFCLENHPKFLQIAWGAHYAGLYYTAISSRLTAEETEYIVNDCGAQVFITSRYKADVAAAIVDRIPNVRSRLMLDGDLDGYESYEAVIGSQPADPSTRPHRGQGHAVFVGDDRTAEGREALDAE